MSRRGDSVAIRLKCLLNETHLNTFVADIQKVGSDKTFITPMPVKLLIVLHTSVLGEPKWFQRHNPSSGSRLW